MKKTLLSVLAGIAVIGSASAVPSPADRKTACEQQPDKVWVEKTQACIDINPCLSDNEDIKKAYCIDDYFLSNYYSLPKGNISLTSAEVVNIYANHVGLNCTVSEIDIQKIHSTSQYGEHDNVYVPCKGTDYVMFMFGRDYGSAHVTDVFCGLVQSRAWENYGGHATRCETSRESCDTLKRLIGDKIKVEYKQERNPEYWSCYIGEDEETTVDGFMWTSPIEVKR